MEWLKKLLEEQGLTAEQIKTITEGVENNYKGYVPEHRFEEVNNAKKQAENDLKERDKQLEALSKSAGDNEELKKQIKQLQDDNKAANEKYESDMYNHKLDTALRLKLKGEVHENALEIAIKEFDKTRIVLNDDGTIKSGFDEQEKTLRESKVFLFVDKQDNQTRFKGSKPPEGGGNKGGGQPNPWKKETFNLTEQGKILRENPDLAKQLQAAAK